MELNNKDVIMCLRDLANGETIPSNPRFGLCYYLWNDCLRHDLEDILQENVYNWEYYSGSKAYPIPSDIDYLAAMERYDNSTWVTKFCLGETTDQYILYRRDLCRWFADYIENNL